MKIYHNFMELVGHTPLVQINNYSKLHNIKTNLLVKLEYFNPAGSAKDRIAKAIIIISRPPPKVGAMLRIVFVYALIIVI